MDDHAPGLTTRAQFCMEQTPDSCGIVIFGASGDLAHRKLIPALFSLFTRGLLPDVFFIVGCGRTPLTDGQFRDDIAATLSKRSNTDPDAVRAFAQRCRYTAGEYDDPSLYSTLAGTLESLKTSGTAVKSMVFYLAVPPVVYGTVVRHLGASGIIAGCGDEDAARIVLEKPFGYDLGSAQALSRDIREVLTERQIYRIDHYLGKETVQNILMFRFANAIFEPLWNRRYIDHVQITAAETIGIGHRAGYFEGAGQVRDMFQNHMMQMLSLVAMEPPSSFDADRMRDEKVKVLRAVRPFDLQDLASEVVRGQYGPGTVDGEPVPGYRDEYGVEPSSATETYAAARLWIDNWRWQGVPFYLRSGKRLSSHTSSIAIVFRDVPHSLFSGVGGFNPARNVLTLTVQPQEGVSLTIEAKSPGPKMCISLLALNVRYREVFGIDPPDAYERLLLDCMLGDQTLFIREDDMIVAWSLFTPVLEQWADNPPSSPLEIYPAGSWGPDAACGLIERDGRRWIDTSPQHGVMPVQ